MSRVSAELTEEEEEDRLTEPNEKVTTSVEPRFWPTAEPRGTVNAI